MAHIAFIDANLPGLDTIRCAKEAGHHVTFLRAQPKLYGDSPEHDRFLEATVDCLLDLERTTDPAQVAAALREAGRRRKIDAVITQNEFATEAAALACRELGLPFTRAEGVVAARRKHICRQRLAEAGIPSARFGLAATPDEAVQIAESIGYPAVLKPTSGGDSILAFVSADAAAVRDAAAAIQAGVERLPAAWRDVFARGILVEEWLSGVLVSVEIGIRGDEHHVFCVSGRFRFSEDETVELGSFIPSNLPDEAQRACADYAAEVCRALGLDLGIFHLEVMLTERGPILVEANPRLMGGGLPFIYECAAGHNIHRSLLQLFTGNRIEGHPAVIPGFAAGRKIMVKQAGRLPDAIDLDWLADHGETVARFDNYTIQPGRAVARGDVIGRLILRGRDYRTVVGTAHEILRRLERDLGIVLMIDEYDHAAEGA